MNKYPEDSKRGIAGMDEDTKHGIKDASADEINGLGRRNWDEEVTHEELDQYAGVLTPMQELQRQYQELQRRDAEEAQSKSPPTE